MAPSAEGLASQAPETTEDNGTLLQANEASEQDSDRQEQDSDIESPDQVIDFEAQKIEDNGMDVTVFQR